MEKISSILPSKPRIISEKEKLPPVRPGAPAFGRPEGSNAIRDRVNLSSIKNIGPQDFHTYKNPKETKNVRMIDDMSRKFFLNESETTTESPVELSVPPIVEGLAEIEGLKNVLPDMETSLSPQEKQ